MNKRFENFNKQNRLSNFEVLRIWAMLMIIGAHLACHGIQHCEDANVANIIFYQGSLLNKIFTSALNVGGEVGVAIFFMLSGYFQVYNRKIRSLRKIILESIFYGWTNVIFFVILKLLGMHTLDSQSAFFYLVKLFFNPISGGAWWFISSYILLIILSPYINKILLKLNDRGWMIFLIGVWLLWYSIGHVDRSSYYFIQRSILFYSLGAYYRLKAKKGKIHNIFSLLFIIVVMWGIGAFFFYLISVYSGQENIRMKVLSNFIDILKTSFIVPICAYLLFSIFAKWNLKTTRWINVCAQTTLGIYLIHDSVIFRNFIWYELIKVDTVLYKSVLFPIYAIVTIFGVFFICSIIDLFRIKYIEPKMINFVDKLCMKYNKNLLI